VLGVIDNQVRSLRKRQLIASLQDKLRAGTYWGIRSDMANYAVPGGLPCPLAATTALADTPTRLKRMDDPLQERLINWGYAICDAAMRKHVASTNGVPRFPYTGGV
jgi:NTE family protein